MNQKMPFSSKKPTLAGMLMQHVIVVEKSNEFLQSSQASSKTIFVIANWKSGALMGGVLTLFTALYVVGYTLGFLKMLF